ncbi:hypothetical protein QMP26_41805 (plasmid) [Enterocloster clostridioformis]
MGKYSIIEFFVLSEVRDALDIYECAYRLCRYPQIMEDIDFHAAFYGEDDPMEWIFNNYGTEEWAALQITRYSWCYRRLVDYTLFCLSLCGILPEIGSLYLCKQIVMPDMVDYCFLEGKDDTAYEDYCERYITRIFHAAGWTITYLDYEEFSNDEEYQHLVVPVVCDDSIGFLHDYEIEGDEDCMYYIFTSEEEYSFVTLFFIFNRFFTEAAIGIVNNHKVVLCIPVVTIVRNIIFDSDWSRYCPLSALDALFYYMYKKLFGTPRLEMMNECKD